jgi:hypothetical protein
MSYKLLMSLYFNASPFKNFRNKETNLKPVGECFLIGTERIKQAIQN